jgi:hypothetical protein
MMNGTYIIFKQEYFVTGPLNRYNTIIKLSVRCRMHCAWTLSSETRHLLFTLMSQTAYEMH